MPIMTLLHPAYFGNIIFYAAYVQAEAIVFEVCDNFQKQSYRTRTKIATATGALQLNIPIIHSKNKEGHQRTADVCIENKFHWQRDHWRSLKVAYQTSPFFEYYEDQLYPLYHMTFEKLMDFNLSAHKVVLDCIQMEPSYSFTDSYEKNPAILDLRTLESAKKEPVYNLKMYHQLFQDKHGFLSNLSVLDLLFNEGPNTLNYLEDLEFSF